MKIQEGKLLKESLSELRDYAVRSFLENSENITSVRPEGILDCIFNVTAETESEIQDLADFLAKQANPEYATGIWQDILYERLGVKRLSSAKASFLIELSGSPNVTVDKNAILIRDEILGTEYENRSDFSFDSVGKANVVFSSINYAKINICENSTFKIVRAPVEVLSLDNTTITDIFAGRDRESDEDYRIRFRNSKALNSKATRRANFANLNKYIDNAASLRILDKNNDLSIPAGKVKITVKHNTTDSVFAQAVFDTFGAGITFIGDTSVIVKDLSNQDVTVKFHNAQTIPICIKATLLIDNSFQETEVFQNIKSEISEYVKKKGFGLESTIYSTEFIVPILNTKGVVAVTEIEIKREPDFNYTDKITLAYDEVPVFTTQNIHLEGEN